MLAKRVVPCLDVMNGRVVKGVNFEGLRDAGDPVEHATVYSRERADELVFLDITASTEGRDIVVDMVRRVADAIDIPFTVAACAPWRICTASRWRVPTRSRSTAPRCARRS